VATGWDFLSIFFSRGRDDKALDHITLVARDDLPHHRYVPISILLL